MDISIVVPYHGEDTYLKDCLLSLAEQTVTNFEVILVASGTDIPEDIISSFGDRINIKAYHTDKTIVAAVRNEGMEYASGDYIMFLDCDDYLAVDFIEKLYNMVTSEGLDFSFGKLENTWYKRSIYLDQNSEKVQEEEDEDE